MILDNCLNGWPFVVVLMLFYTFLWILDVTALKDIRLTDNENEKTTRPPCCMDSLSRITCRRLLHLNEVSFAHRCNTSAEFRLIQCCGTCNKHNYSLPYDRIAPVLVCENCSDRYGKDFCQKYVNALDVWKLKQWSCDGYSPYMAFRVCRKTCGFCDLDRLNYTLSNAISACKMNSG